MGFAHREGRKNRWVSSSDDRTTDRTGSRFDLPDRAGMRLLASMCSDLPPAQRTANCALQPRSTQMPRQSTPQLSPRTQRVFEIWRWT